MAIEEFKQEINGLFPCRWKNDFIHNNRVTFDRYISIVSSIDGITSDVLVDVKYMCSKLTEVLKLYYDGLKGESFKEFLLIMNDH